MQTVSKSVDAFSCIVCSAELALCAVNHVAGSIFTATYNDHLKSRALLKELSGTYRFGYTCCSELGDSRELISYLDVPCVCCC